LQGCKDYRDCIVAVLGRKLESGGNKAAKSRPVHKDGKAPGRAQNLLAGCIFVGVADKSAFALLSQKVTKAMRLSAQFTR
jgi:hypothetical protein